MNIVIEKKRTGFDLESLTELWVSPMPETHGLGRTRITLAKYVEVKIGPFQSEFSTNEIAIFSARSGGNLLWDAPTKDLYVSPSDTIIYRITFE